jgi:hypothetical protein
VACPPRGWHSCFGPSACSACGSIPAIQQGKLAAIDGSVVTVLGILMTGKTVQRFGEQTDDSENDATDQNDKVKGH